MIKINYYDGHYPDTGRTLEEIEKEIQECMEKDKELTEWPDID